MAEQSFAPSVQQTRQLQTDLWQLARAEAERNANPLMALFISALNDMFDMSEKRLSGVGNRIPESIWVMLILMSLLTCLTVGYSAAARFWMVWVVSPLMIAIVMWLIADLNSPRSGLIRTDSNSLVRLQKNLHPSGSATSKTK